MTDARAEIVDAATAAQRDAADPRAHAFVSANAGSGKTRVLVDRIARLLLAGADPGAILGLTYTKAAASEMQSRLFARLGAWSVASDPDLAADLADLDPAASTPGAERLSQARRLFARALETPGGLKIQTLHAFCERLLRLFPLEAGLAPGFEVAEEAEAARLRDAATNALVQRADDPDLREALSFFAVRAGDQAQAEAIAFSRTAGAAIAKRAQTLGGAGALVARLAARLGVSPQDTEAGLKAEAWAAAPHNALARAVDVLAQGGKTDAEQSARLAAALAAPDAEAAYDAYLGFLFPQKGLELKESLHSKALGASHPWLERYFGARKGDRRYGMEALRMRAARGHVHAGSVFERSRAALSLGLAYGSAYARAKAGRGVLDFDDLVGRAVDLLTEGEAAGWVLYKLDGGVSHILIDEAQDTAPDQWRVADALSEEFFAGAAAQDERRTMFIVGDEKQSIYGFQGARPERFRAQGEALETKSTDAGLRFARPEMATSFRSAPEILAFVDEIFEGGGLERKFLAASANAPAPRYVRHISARTGRGAVELWPALEATEKVSAADPWSPVDAVDDAHARVRLACALAQRVRDDVDLGFAEPGDFLILCRRRSALFFEIIRRLKSAGLPTAGADRIVLAEHIAVQDMLAAARAGLAPWDDLSVAETLKGPFVRLDEIALYDLAALRPPGQRLWPCLREHADPRFGVAQTRLKDWIGAARRLSPFAFFSRLLNTVDPDGRSGAQALYARHGAEAQDAVEALLARALAHDRRGGPSLERFVVELSRDQGEVKREPEAVQNAVRVMTVHGAKGLEAPVVILPDTTQARPGRRDPGFFHDPDVGLIWSSKADLDPPAAAALRASAEDAAEAEDRRLLYVALTRARDRLIVCGHKTGRAPGKVEEDSWYALAEAAMARADGAAFDAPTGTGRRIGPAPEARVKAGPSQVSPKAHPPWLAEAAPKPEAVVAPLAPSRAILDQDGAALSPLAQPVTEGVARGRLTHALLERLPAMAPQARAAAADAYLRRHGPEAADARAAIWEAVRTVLEAPGFAAVFGPGSRAEAALAGPIRPGGPVASGVVDRLVVGADGIWVVDYKTNRDAVSRGEDAAPAHIAQMAAYKGVLSTLYPDRPVRCALLFTQAPALVPLPDSLLERALAEMTAG